MQPGAPPVDAHVLPPSWQGSATHMRWNWRSVHLMAKRVVTSKKRRGRPAARQAPVTALRLPGELRARVDAWAAQQQGAPGRSEAIRRLVETALAAAGPVKKLPKKIAAKARRLAGNTIDRLIDKSAPPAEQAKRKRRLLKGPPEFRRIRADLPKAKPR